MDQISGKDFQGMLFCGAYNLKENYKRVDDLNVFPVPDGDTGSNMLKTFMSGIKAIKDVTDDDRVSDVAQKFAKGLLLGARGNSGVILSQIFAGFSSIYSETKVASKDTVIKSLVSARDKAYNSVSNPVEGTILTVISDATKAVVDNKEYIDSLEEICNIYLTEAKASLDRTPLLLPVLKEAGVVDSGGAGFTTIISGMTEFFKGTRRTYEELTVGGEDNHQQVTAADYMKYDFYELNQYGYCTEFTIKLNPNLEFEKDSFTKKLELYGYSIVVVNSDDIVKVHIHTKTPGEVFTFAQKYGALCAVKAENMTIQTKENSSLVVEKVQRKKKVQKERNKYGVVAVLNGQGLKDIFTAFGVDEIIDGGQTMNPSTQDFLDAIDNVNAEHVFIIPNNKNVYMSAKAAKALVNDKHVIVVPAKTISQGYAAMMCYDESEEPRAIAKDMEAKIQTVKSGEITYSIRKSTSNGIQIEKDDFISILDGSIVNSCKTRIESLKDLINKIVKEDTMSLTIFYGDDVSEEELEEVNEYLDNNVEAFHQLIEGNQKIYSYIVEAE